LLSKKIHELAKELNVTSKRLMEKLQEVDIHPKSHMSTLEDDELSKLYKYIGVQKKRDGDDELVHSDSESKLEAAERLKKKNAPRIIRKTEVVFRDSEDYSKQQKDKENNNNKGRKDFVRTSNNNDGLMAGYVRGVQGVTVRKHNKIDELSAEKEAEVREQERTETIRLVERPAKAVDDILGVKKITRAERAEREAERAERDAEREARDHVNHHEHHAHANKPVDHGHVNHQIIEGDMGLSRSHADQEDILTEQKNSSPATAQIEREETSHKNAEMTESSKKMSADEIEYTESADLKGMKKHKDSSDTNHVQTSKAVEDHHQITVENKAKKASSIPEDGSVQNSETAAGTIVISQEDQPEGTNTAKTHHQNNMKTDAVQTNHQLSDRPARPQRPVQTSIRDTIPGTPPRREGQGGAVIRPATTRPPQNRDGGQPRPSGDRPYPPRDNANNRPNNDRPYGDRPNNDRPNNDRPYGDRPNNDRPYGDRPNNDRPYGDRPNNDRPYGDRPNYQRDAGTPRPVNDRPYPPRDNNGPRPIGDRPYQPRPGGNMQPRPGGGDRPYPPRDSSTGGRPPYGDRPYTPRDSSSGGRPSYGDRPAYNNGGGGGFKRDGEGYDKDSAPQTFNRSNVRPSGPKTDKPSILDEKNYQRGERRSMSVVDRQREAKKDTRKESVRPVGSIGTNAGKFKPNPDIVGQKGDIKDMYSDEFVINAFYNDKQEVMNAKRAEKRIRRNRIERVKHIPPKAVLTEITIGDTITVKNLAEAMKKTAADVIKRLFVLGSAATINQELDFDTASIIASEYGITATRANIVSDEEILFDDTDDKPESLVQRAPVVVVMGHVDHGKTSLLDAIRSEKIADNEAGGITQHIGAYTVNLHGRDITFLDTPGHEAFTAMRARGAQVTDIAIIVVAADDGVMPQTVEAIHHAKAAGVSIIIAINKIDKPNANQERVKQELTQHGIVIEEWGGDIIAVPVSAKQHENIDQLLEMVLLTADLLELKADPARQAKGTVVEARLDKNKGPIATLLVQRGTLNVGDAILSGATFGHIRAMSNDKGRRIKDAGPSVAVEITGLSEVPEAGELFYVVNDERVAKNLAERRRRETHEKAIGGRNRITLDDLYNQIQSGKVEELNLIIKADVQGSVEAIKATLIKLSNDKVKVKIVHDAVGSVTESDILLAEVANAIIIGFNIRPSQNVMSMAESAGVDMRLYRVIYEAISDVEKAMKGLLAPTFKEVIDGHIEIRQIFKVSNVGTIGGSFVVDGKVTRNSEIRVVREGIVVFDGKLASLKRFKDDVREASAGFECGVMVEKFNDILVGDIVEAFHQEQVEV